MNEAEDYIRSNSVQDLSIEENRVTARVIGGENFNVDIRLNGDSVSSMKCNCPYAGTGSNCKHMAAVMLAWENHVKAETESRTDAALESMEAKTPEVKRPELKEKQPVIDEMKKGLQLTCDIDDVLTYAIVHNGAHIVRDICIKNISEVDRNHLMVRISSSNELIENFNMGIEQIKPGEEIHLKNLDVPIHAGYLASLTERSSCQMTVGIYFEENLLVSETVNITALAFDQWPGLQYTPELLVSFAMPNHPVVTSMIQLAAQYLEKWTGDPSLAGYQFEDPNRVKNMAAAVYAAIQQKNITYAEPPSSFEEFGQRILWRMRYWISIWEPVWI